jgi:hypothetical protein
LKPRASSLSTLARLRAQMERDGAPDIHRLGWATGAAAKLVALAGRVGADPLESSDAALQRRLLVLMSVGTLPMTVLWSVTYFAAGAPLAASAPAVYSVVTPIKTALLGWTRTSASTASPSF